MSTSSQLPHESPPSGSHYQPSLGVVAIILVLFVGATFLMLRSSSPNSTSPTTTVTSASSVTTLKSPGGTTTTIPTKAQVRVQVANGTLTTGLARTYTQQLMTLGWDTLPQLNASKVAATVIYYNPGYLWAAQQIASSLKVSSSAIKTLNGLTPVAGASGDDVIVILGPDIAIQG